MLNQSTAAFGATTVQLRAALQHILTTALPVQVTDGPAGELLVGVEGRPEARFEITASVTSEMLGGDQVHWFTAQMSAETRHRRPYGPGFAWRPVTDPVEVTEMGCESWALPVTEAAAALAQKVCGHVNDWLARP